MKRYQLNGRPHPEGPLVYYSEVAPLLSPELLVALIDYAEKLAAWDARPHEAVHSFEDAGLDDGLRAALRAGRAKQDAHYAAIAEGIR